MIERGREHADRAKAPAADKHKPKYSMTGLPINLLEKLKKKQL